MLPTRDDLASGVVAVQFVAPTKVSLGTHEVPRMSGLAVCVSVATSASGDARESTDRAKAVRGRLAAFADPSQGLFGKRCCLAVFAKPPTITSISSLLVSSGRYGLMTSGASVWPTKMFAAVESVSAPEVPIVFCITTAKK